MASENVGRGLLLVERLLVEQPRVLDGDHSLVGKCLEQVDLSVGEPANLGASNGDHADGLARADQGDPQYGAQAKASRIVAALWVLIIFGLQIGEVNRSLVEDDTCHEKPPRQGEGTSDEDWPMVGDEQKRVAVHLADHHVIGIT
jgi:hypothetical protein